VNISEIVVENNLNNPEFEQIKNQVVLVFESFYYDFYNYFQGFSEEIKGKKWYTCNGDECNTPKVLTSAIIRYIAQRSDYRELNSGCSLTQILSLKNAYNKHPILSEDLKLINPNDLSGKTRVLVNGETFFESKKRRINDLGLEDYVEVINNPKMFTSTDDTSQLSL
jgi:hypothetical protein